MQHYLDAIFFYEILLSIENCNMEILFKAATKIGFDKITEFRLYLILHIISIAEILG
jgi:hypothetical protein